MKGTEIFQNINLLYFLQILNAGAWARGSERVTVSLPLQLEDYIPEVEEFYKKKHSGRKLQWHHHMSNGTVLDTLTKFYSRARTILKHANLNFYCIFYDVDVSDNICKQSGTLRYRCNDLPNGGVIRLESTTQRKDLL